MTLKLSYTEAEAAFRQILVQYSPYIPVTLFTSLKAKPITDIYEICDAARYKAMFDVTWNRTFMKANAVLFPGQVFTAAQVPAFTSDVEDVETRKIYLQDGVMSSWGTYFHEAIHLLQHRDFYPIYYATGGDAPFRMEGLTEYLTRYFSTNVRREREQHQNYERNFLKTKSWIGSNLDREGELFHMNFNGTGMPQGTGNAAIVNMLQGVVP